MELVLRMLRAVLRNPNDLVGVVRTRSAEEWVSRSARCGMLTQSAPAWEAVDNLSAHFDGSGV